MNLTHYVKVKSANGRFTFYADTLCRCVYGFPTIDYAYLNSFRLSSCLYGSCIYFDLTCNICPCKL